MDDQMERLNCGNATCTQCGRVYASLTPEERGTFATACPSDDCPGAVRSYAEGKLMRKYDVVMTVTEEFRAVVEAPNAHLAEAMMEDLRVQGDVSCYFSGTPEVTHEATLRGATTDEDADVVVTEDDIVQLRADYPWLACE